jgi:hypothetical protein
MVRAITTIPRREWGDYMSKLHPSKCDGMRCNFTRVGKGHIMWAHGSIFGRARLPPQQFRQLRDIRRDPPRFACNAALHYAQESVMEFAAMESNLLRVG